jgi:hypothetical protein
VKAKDTEAIKAVMSTKTHALAEMQAQRTKQTLAQVYENGFTGTTFSPTLPEIRDERINGDMGALEVYSTKDSRWEDLPFIKEDGTWKLAFGDAWNGSYKSPGKGRDQKEKEAANAMSPANNMIRANVNTNAKPTIIKPSEMPAAANTNVKPTFALPKKKPLTTPQ